MEANFYLVMKIPAHVIHEHINDAINGGIEEAGSWVVRAVEVRLPASLLEVE